MGTAAALRRESKVPDTLARIMRDVAKLLQPPLNRVVMTALGRSASAFKLVFQIRRGIA